MSDDYTIALNGLKEGIETNSSNMVNDNLDNLYNRQLTLKQATELQTYLNKIMKKNPAVLNEANIIPKCQALLEKIRNIKSSPQSLASAGENLASLAPLAQASLQGYGLQLQGNPGELGLEEIRATTGNLQNLQQQFNEAMGIIVTTQKKFEEDSLGKAESELARLSAEADAEVKKQTERIMALYIKMGEAAAIMAAKRQVQPEEIVAIQTNAETRLNKIRQITPSYGARLEVSYNRYFRPVLNAIKESLPDKKDVAVTSIASTALLGTGIITAQTIAPAAAAAAGQTAMAAASSLLLPPVPLATGLSGTVLYALCDVLGSGIFGGLSLACLIALLSNEGTRNRMLDILRRSRDKAGSMASSAASYLTDSWAAQQLAKLARASEDVVNNLRTSAEARLHSVLIERGLATSGNEDSDENKKEIQDDIKDIQQILNDAPGMTDELKALAKENGCDEETGNCSIEALTAAAVALSNASSRVPSRSVSVAVSQSTTPMRQGQGDSQGEYRVIMPKAKGSSSAKGPAGMSLLKEKLGVIVENQDMDTSSNNMGVPSDNNNNSSSSSGEPGGMDVGGRRKSKQRKTKQRKTKRQVKRRRQTKKGKKRSQTKKVVRRMTLQSQMKQQKQKMSSQQMQQQMMNQQMMKYKSHMY